MAARTSQGMSLIAADGTRKYLSASERARFLGAIPSLHDPGAETYCEMLYWTGCRPSEALALTSAQIDHEDGTIVFCTLKKRGTEKGRHFRQVPVPDVFMARLGGIHDLEARGARLWPFSRSTSWRLVNRVMRAAGISGIKASAKGLRHSYGVTAALNAVPETRIKKWLGHTNELAREMTLAKQRASQAPAPSPDAKKLQGDFTQAARGDPADLRTTDQRDGKSSEERAPKDQRGHARPTREFKRKGPGRARGPDKGRER